MSQPDKKFSGAAVLFCGCKEENGQQDRMYGKGRRVMNKCAKGYRCTNCGKEKNTGSPESKK